MRMFDTSAPSTGTGKPLSQELCAHIWGREPVEVRVSEAANDDLIVYGRAYSCEICRVYLVMYDRRG